MKKTILALSFLMAVTFAFAQQNAVVESPAKKTETVQSKTDELAIQLSLTTEQKSKVHALALDFFNQRQKLVPLKETLGKEAFKEKLKTLVKESEAKLNALLTPEQQQKFAVYRKANK